MLYNKATSSPAFTLGFTPEFSISNSPFSLTETSDTLKSSIITFLFWFMEAVIPIWTSSCSSNSWNSVRSVLKRVLYPS